MKSSEHNKFTTCKVKTLRIEVAVVQTARGRPRSSTKCQCLAVVPKCKRVNASALRAETVTANVKIRTDRISFCRHNCPLADSGKGTIFPSLVETIPCKVWAWWVCKCVKWKLSYVVLKCDSLISIPVQLCLNVSGPHSWQLTSSMQYDSSQPRQSVYDFRPHVKHNHPNKCRTNLLAFWTCR